jgi:hypothetical protein
MIMAFSFVWLWAVAIARFLVCVLGCLLGSGLFLVVVELWCMMLWFHNHVGFTGCGCGGCWCELVVRGFLWLFGFICSDLSRYWAGCVVVANIVQGTGCNNNSST